MIMTYNALNVTKVMCWVFTFHKRVQPIPYPSCRSWTQIVIDQSNRLFRHHNLNCKYFAPNIVSIL
jgi:hypothetical protein